MNPLRGRGRGGRLFTKFSNCFWNHTTSHSLFYVALWRYNFFFFYHTTLDKIGPRPINFKGKDKYNYEFLDLKNGSTQTQLVE